MPPLSLNADDEVVHLEAPQIYLDQWVSDRAYADMIVADTRDLGLLPPGVRFVSSSRTHVFVEEAPRTHTITVRINDLELIRDDPDEDDPADAAYLHAYNGGATQDGWGTFTLPFPWITYIIRIDPFAARVEWIFTHIAPLSRRSGQDYLCYLPLPNVYTTGKICFPPEPSVTTRQPRSTAESINAAIDQFWSSAFNQEVYDYVNSYIWLFLHNGLQSALSVWKKWEQMTIDDVLALPWAPIISVRDQIAHIESENRIGAGLHHANPRQALLMALAPFHHLSHLRVDSPP